MGTKRTANRSLLLRLSSCALPAGVFARKRFDGSIELANCGADLTNDYTMNFVADVRRDALAQEAWDRGGRNPDTFGIIRRLP